MALGAHYTDEDDLKALITIPIAAASLAAYLEAGLTLIDNRINHFSNLSANLTSGIDFDALNSVELNAFLVLQQFTRLTREGVPAEINFKDQYFGVESRQIMAEIYKRTKRTIWVEDI